MPHTSTRHRKPRRHNLPSPDGWTHISYTSSPSRAAASIAAHSLPPSDAASNPGFYTADPTLTTATLSSEFNTYLSRWRSSPARARVRQALLDGDARAHTAVCLGLGAVGRADRRRSMWQLAAFVDVATLCGAGETVVQEPWLVPGDGGFLAGLGVRVLDAERDEALGLVGEGTLVFCAFMERGEEGRYRARARESGVVGYVSTPVPEGEEGVWRGGYEVVRWPEWEEQGMALEGLVMYLRRDGGGDGSGDVRG